TATSFAVPVVPDVLKINAMESNAGWTDLRATAGVSRTCRNATLERDPAAGEASINPKELLCAIAKAGESTQLGSTRASSLALASASSISVAGRLELRGTLIA